jgi:hypothetical protein
MRELLIPIAVNLALGLILLALLFRKRTSDTVRLTQATEAIDIFRMHFPDALGTATVAADGRGALIDLQRGGTGLLQRHGRRWNARLLAPGELSSVQQSANAIELGFTDFGWPRARLCIADAGARAMWVARLKSLVSRDPSQPHSDPHHA